MECSPQASIAITTSPGRTRAGPSSWSASTTPVVAPATSYSSGASRPGVLGGLAADQRAAGLGAALGDALDDRGDPLGHDPAGGDVVGHEQRLGAADDEVVDDHADQVEADRVVHVHRLGDRDLGADTVGRGRQQRAGVAGQRGGVEEPGEAAEPTDHLGAAWPSRSSPSSARWRCRRPRCRRRPRRRRWSRSRRGLLAGSRVVEDGQRLAQGRRAQARLEQVLAEQALVGQLDGVVAGEAGRAQRSTAVWPVASTMPSSEM